MKHAFRPLLLLGYALILLTPPCAMRAADSQQAREVLDLAGVRGGLIVHLGCGNGQLTAALLLNGSYVVHGLDADAKNVETARQSLQSAGLYGKVTVEQWTAKRLPYADNLVNLVVAENLGAVSMDEVMRVLAPLGVACVKSGGKWTKTVKPWPKEIDEWTHYMHGPDNNAVAHDTVVGPPKYMQWVAEPLYGRSHEIDSSVSALVSARGRLFYILDEGPKSVADQRLPEQWALVARDAFNGVILWKVPLPDWGWPAWKKELLIGKDWTTLLRQRANFPAALPKRLVADGDKVYVTFGFHAPVSQVDAASGALLRAYAGTENADEFVCSEGALVICCRANTGKPMSESLMALNLETGQILWKQEGLDVKALSLAAEAGRIVFNSPAEIVCLDQKTGSPLWRKPSQAARAKKKDREATEGFVEGWQWRVTETLLIQNGIVISMAGDIRAMSLDTGDVLWTAPSPPGDLYDLSPDLFVVDGLVWYGDGKGGLDLKTGAVMRNIDIMNLISVGHHPRCYPSKATDRYLIYHKQGAEFVDLHGDGHMRNDWMRGPCRYGVLPCNGLLYAPPHPCKCYVGSKLTGFNALSAIKQPLPTDLPPAPRQERGPAYAALAALGSQAPASDDWPAYRHDAARSGSVKSSVPASLSQVWQIEVGGKLSQPVVADGRLLVSSLDTHRVLSFDVKTGKPLWTFTAGGRVDSPPTFYKGMILFGSADGWVYCLRASDGALGWRFRAAPEERRVIAFGQVESAWPVHGSVLIQNGIGYATAGRSTFLDGGIHVCALDPATGNLLNDAIVEGPYPDIVNDPGGSGYMDGATADVLVGDGKFVYMRQVKFDADLKQLKPAAPVAPREKRYVGLHLMASSSLLDDSGFNRIGWTYGDTWPIAQGSSILSFNSTTTYGAQPFTRPSGQSQVYFPGMGCIRLFANKNGYAPDKQDAAGEDGAQSPAAQQTEKQPKKKKKSGKADEEIWFVTLPVFVRAMALADQTLFVAGPPDVLDPKDPLGALEGRKGSELWAVSTTDGQRLAQLLLPSVPAFDGMVAAGGRLFLSTADGKVLCLGVTAVSP